MAGVRAGAAFRSDSLHHLTDDDIASVRARRRLRSIDLRTARELEASGHGTVFERARATARASVPVNVDRADQEVQELGRLPQDGQEAHECVKCRIRGPADSANNPAVYFVAGRPHGNDQRTARSAGCR
jgi:hypothetical protein